MTFDAAVTLVILLLTIFLLSSPWLRNDLSALIVMASLVLTGVLGADETFRAFGQPVIVLIASIYIIGAALYETGVAAIIANQLLRLQQRGSLVLLLGVMLIAGLLSALLSSLLVTAVLMPAVLRVARRARLAPSRFLIPLTTAANAGNHLTLLAAISNLVINDVLVSSGFEPLGLFSLTPYGFASLGVTILWFVLVGRHLLPTRMPEEKVRPSLDEVEQSYHLQEHLFQLRVRSISGLIGMRLDESGLRSDHRLNVVALQPDQADLQPARPGWILEQDDVLIVEGERGDVYQAAALYHLEPKGQIALDRFETLENQSLRLAEVIVPFRSPLVDRSLGENRFRDRYGLNVLGVHRDGRALRGVPEKLTLIAGDTLLVQGPLERLREIGETLDLVLVTHLGPQRGDLITRKARLTLVITVVMLVAVVSGLLSLAVAGLVASLALILTGCISAERAYKSVDASIIILIGGVLPLATALEKTGLASQAAQVIVGLQLGPLLTLFLLYALAALLTQVISNTVTGVLLMPIAINLAAGQGLSPYPFAIALMIAVNAAYISPLTHSSNLMIRGPAQYQMGDYLRNNLPVFFLQTAVVMTLITLSYL